ncbi:MAG: hypothetical protein V3T65_10120, partial [Acidobacteriota bacterium]
SPHDGPDHRIQPGTVSAAGQDADSFTHGSNSFRESGIPSLFGESAKFHTRQTAEIARTFPFAGDYKTEAAWRLFE